MSSMSQEEQSVVCVVLRQQQQDRIKSGSRAHPLPTPGTPAASEEEGPRGVHHASQQNEGPVSDFGPWSGLFLPGESSWATPLTGTQNELIGEEVCLGCVCVCSLRVSVMWIHGRCAKSLSHV